jgi:hypothetical protein
MTEAEFKGHFVATFLACYAAQRYDDACARGEHDRLQRHPVEDAAELAETAWVQHVQNNAICVKPKEESKP